MSKLVVSKPLLFFGLILIAIAAYAFGVTSASKRTAAGIGKIPEILMIDSTEAGCVFKVNVDKSNSFKEWFRLPKCIEKLEGLTFDPSRNRMLILDHGKYWSVAKTLGAQPEFLADAFKSPVEGDFDSKTWIDKKTGRLTLGYLIPIGQVSNNPEGDDLRKKFPILKDTWISVHHSDGSLPEGAPAVALVAQLQFDGKWNLLAEEKTTCCADGAPELGVVKEFMNEESGVQSFQELLFKPVCANQNCDLSKLKPNAETSEWIEENFAASDEGSSAYMPLGKTDGFFFPTEIGDSLHAMTPIYYCKNNCSERVLIPGPKSAFSQVSFSMKSGLMLVTQEYEGFDARIYKSGFSKPIIDFSSIARVAWLPDDFQF